MAEIRLEKKIEDRRRRNHRAKNIMACPVL